MGALIGIVVPLAHFGHWYVSLIYAAPVIILVGALVIGDWRDKRRKRREQGRDS